MRISLPKIAAYYRACYQADFRAVHLLNFFGKKVEHPLILEEADLLTGKLQQMPVSSEWGKQVDAYLDIYSKEKALFCCVFFLLGRSKLLGRSQSVCAPLLIYPTELVEADAIYYLSVDMSNPTLNPAVIEILNRAEDHPSTTQETLADQIPTGVLSFEAAYQFERAVTELFPKVEMETLASFPDLLPRATINGLLKKSKDGFQIISAAGVGVVDKGRGARGVLNELELLSNSDDWSVPLRALFTLEEKIASPIRKPRIWVPATLSQAQEKVVENAYRFPLSLVIGPPGTGKTFTIASLAVDLMSKGQSVLIAARNDQAVKVVAEKIETDLGLPGIVVKATSGEYRRAVKERLQEWSKGIGWESYRQSDVQVAQQEKLQRDLEIEKKERLIKNREIKLRDWGQLVAQGRESLWRRIKKWYIKRQLNQASPFWQLILDLEKSYRLRKMFVITFLRIRFQYQLKGVLQGNRWVVRKLISALSARTGNEKDTRFEEMDFSLMLRCMPIWITNTTEAHRLLPNYTELFDLVIIDEASQCDIAGAMPLLQRAKRAVIVGDPKQLRHLSFVSERQQQLFRRQFGLEKAPDFWLNYRNSSLLDLVSDQLPSQEQVQLLDEHYRSMPDIIAFSNRHFYSEQLRIMTATPVNYAGQNVHLCICEGKRADQGHNPQEAQAVLEQIAAILENESGLAADLCQGIGVLSPFRAQVEYLQAEVLQRFAGEQLLRHRILIGTPFAFQGEERDIMLLSFTLQPNSPAGVWTYLNREDVFNVSITRARVQQYLYLSGRPKDFPDGSMLRAYLDFLTFRQESSTGTSLQKPVLDRFMTDVIDHLKSWGVQDIYHHYSIGGVMLDIVVVHRGRTFCIDLVGYPGPYMALLPMTQWKILSRVGIQVFALPFINWYFQPESSKDALRAYIFEDH